MRMRTLQPAFVFSLLLLCGTGCPQEDSEPSGEMQSAAGEGGSGMEPGDEQGGQSTGAGSGGQGGSSGQSSNTDAGGTDDPDATPQDAGAQEDPDPMPDGGMSSIDAGPEPEPDAAVDAGDMEGTIGTGSCCAEHETPGCSNADLQVCVCELLPTCCSEA